MDINFELYKIFYYSAQLKSFSQAATMLFISQSAVSQAIKNLEEKIGMPLFIRDKRSVRLTKEGEILYKHVEQAFNFIKTAESKLTELQNLNSGEIRIGVGDTICKYFLIPSLESFNTQYPNIKIQVINRASSGILSMLKNGTIDFGFVTLPVNDNNISVIDFISVEDVFVASNKFFEIKDRSISFKELLKYPLLTLPKDSSTRRNLDDFFKTRHIEIRPEIELESIDLLLEFAKIGLGFSHVLMESAKAAISKEELFIVQTNEKLPVRNIGIATMDKVPLSRASREFIDLLKNN
jgi:DNA-binding transcriptional LysR family regulator